MLREEEDDNQYLEYLKLKYPDSDVNVLFERIKDHRINSDLKKEEAEEIYAHIDKKESESNLSTIIFPKDKKLSSVPILKRYTAYLVTSYGYAKASELLDMSRTSLWRYIKN